MSIIGKVAIGVLTGFAAGFGAGFFTHKKINDVEFEEIPKEDMDILEEQIMAKTNVNEENKSPIPGIEKVSDLPEDPNKIRMTLQGKVSYLEADKEAKTQYSNIWNTIRGYSNEENADELPIEEGFDPGFIETISEDDVTESIGNTDTPHPITLDEFYNERKEYDKITLDWYEPMVFLDEKEEIIADLSSYIGSINILKLFEENGPEDDPDIRFVRNDDYGTDYEIVRHHRTWKETIGGSE